MLMQGGKGIGCQYRCRNDGPVSIRIGNLVSELSRQRIAAAVGNRLFVVEDGSIQIGIAPRLVKADHDPRILLVEIGGVYPAIMPVPVVLRQLLRKLGAPDEAVMVALEPERAVDEAIIRSIQAACIAKDLAIRNGGRRQKVNHAANGVGTVA